MQHKIVFTLLSIFDDAHILYFNSCKNLTDEILAQTPYDIIITTNDVSKFSEYELNNRVKIRPLPDYKLILYYTSEFNYNLKHLCYKDIPIDYDYIIYLDGDLKLSGWDEKSDNYINHFFYSTNEAGATRTDAIFEDELRYYKEGKGLFKHKFSIYPLDDILSLGKNILFARLPSEHFLILRNIPEKVNKFYETWKYLNNFLQEKNGGHGSLCDAFEIGISLQAAGFNVKDISWTDSILYLKFMFNGNKV